MHFPLIKTCELGGNQRKHWMGIIGQFDTGQFEIGQFDIGQFDTADNLTPQTIWHRGQFDTTDNLTPRTIWHRTIWHWTIWHRKIWHQDNLTRGLSALNEFDLSIYTFFVKHLKKCAKSTFSHEVAIDQFKCNRRAKLDTSDPWDIVDDLTWLPYDHHPHPHPVRTGIKELPSSSLKHLFCSPKCNEHFSKKRAGVFLEVASAGGS